MRLFTPDFFSISKPHWNRCSQKSVKVIDNLVRLELPMYWKRNNSYFQTGSHEINSSNYKIEIGGTGDAFVLKKWPEKTDVQKILDHNHILDFFNAEGIPSPKKMRFRDTTDYCEFKGNIWTLQEFKKGDFFNGDITLFNQLINRVLELQEKLKENFSLENNKVVSIDFEYRVLQEFMDGARRFEQFFQSEDLELLKDNFMCISKAFQHVREIPLDLNQRSICHLDLHPHNILIDKQDVNSFLDFDSVNNVNSAVAMAYFSLKTCKQACVKNEDLEPVEVGNMFLDLLLSKAEEFKKYADLFSVLANAEVLRRIDILLRLNVYENNKEWNKVLPVLLAHLIESEILFRRYPR